MAKKKTKATKKHLRGVGAKEQRQYEHIKRSAQASGRYGKRAKEVAARTVLKQHKERATERAIAARKKKGEGPRASGGPSPRTSRPSQVSASDGK